jgi:GTP pyrophosphokinase
LLHFGVAQQNRFLISARAVVKILQKLGCDSTSLVASYIFDLYDSNSDGEEVLARALQADFGAEAWKLVAAMMNLTALRKFQSSQNVVSEHQQLETLRRMLLAMVTDERVALIRLAFELQTLRSVADSKQVAPAGLAAAALLVWSPLANRLGLWQLKWEIEDLAFRFSEPLLYKQIARQLEDKRTERAIFVQNFGDSLNELLTMKGFAVVVSRRPKHIYSIYKRMLAKQVPLEGLSDLHAFRVLVNSVQDCYGVLAAVHERWPAVSSEYDDYVARPKPNGYRSLHTVVKADDGRTLEVQIRTHEMHQFAEHGVASHWRYKEGISSKNDLQSKVQKNLLRWTVRNYE